LCGASAFSEDGCNEADAQTRTGDLQGAISADLSLWAPPWLEQADLDNVVTGGTGFMIGLLLFHTPSQKAQLPTALYARTRWL